MKLILFSFIAIALVLTAGASADHGDQSKGMRPNFKLPSLFNFAQFKSSFHKHYGSLIEELVRQKIFLGRAVQAFVSVVKYSHRKVTSYLAVNQQSDRTIQELKQTYVPLENLMPGSLEGSDYHEPNNDEDGDVLDEAEEIPVANPDEIASQLNYVEQHSEEPGYREIAQELQKQEEVAQFAPTSAMEVEDKSEQSPVPSNNPNYLPPVKLETSEHSMKEEREGLPTRLVSVLSSLPGMSFVRNAVNDAASKVAKLVSDDDDEGVEMMEEDEVWVDLRQSGCLGPVKGQGKCGGCYAFAGIALYEYLYCLATGKQVSFSEQYLISCGPRIGMYACQGGQLDATAYFVDNYGLELAEHFPYQATNATCPYDDETPAERMGYIKPLTKGWKLINMSDFETYLESSTFKAKDKQVIPAGRPILFGLYLSSEFPFYGGGLHDPDDCNEDFGHAMLLVGHGRQDGLEYWLFRNSHSPNWGESGYYKISKRAVEDCEANPVGVVSAARFARRTQHQVNPMSRQVLGSKRLQDEAEAENQEPKRRRRT